MNKTDKFNIYIGLLKNDMKTKINKQFALNTISDLLTKHNIIGFNIELNTIGFYKGIKEDNIKLSFINTYDLKTKEIIIILQELKIKLNQECILLEKEKVLYNFV